MDAELKPDSQDIRKDTGVKTSFNQSKQSYSATDQSEEEAPIKANQSQSSKATTPADGQSGSCSELQFASCSSSLLGSVSDSSDSLYTARQTGSGAASSYHSFDSCDSVTTLRSERSIDTPEITGDISVDEVCIDQNANYLSFEDYKSPAQSDYFSAHSDQESRSSTPVPFHSTTPTSSTDQITENTSRQVNMADNTVQLENGVTCETVQVFEAPVEESVEEGTPVEVRVTEEAPVEERATKETPLVVDVKEEVPGKHILEVTHERDGTVKVRESQCSPKQVLINEAKPLSPEEERLRIQRIKRTSGRSTAAAEAWLQTAKETEAVPEKPRPARSKNSVLDKFKMFQNADAGAPLEFGVHVTTKEDLEEMTKRAKSIFISQEEQKEQKKKKAIGKLNTAVVCNEGVTLSSAAKVTTQSARGYQSTVKPNVSNAESANTSANPEQHTVRSIMFTGSKQLTISMSTESVCSHTGSESSENKRVEADSNDLVELDDESGPIETCPVHADADSTHPGAPGSGIQLKQPNDCHISSPLSLRSASEPANDMLDGSQIANQTSDCSQTDEGSAPNSSCELSSNMLTDASTSQCNNLTETNSSVIKSTEMSQAARISNFLEAFARTSSESTNSSFSKSTEKVTESVEESVDYVDAISLVVPPRPAALSREGSIRSSFEMYNIREESDEDEQTDSPRSKPTQSSDELAYQQESLADEPGEELSAADSKNDDAENFVVLSHDLSVHRLSCQQESLIGEPGKELSSTDCMKNAPERSAHDPSSHRESELSFENTESNEQMIQDKSISLPIPAESPANPVLPGSRTKILSESSDELSCQQKSLADQFGEEISPIDFQNDDPEKSNDRSAHYESELSFENTQSYEQIIQDKSITLLIPAELPANPVLSGSRTEILSESSDELSCGQESLANEPDEELSPIDSENNDPQESGPVNPVFSGSRTEILSESSDELSCGQESLANEPDGELSPINSENDDPQESGPVNPVLSGSRTEILSESSDELSCGQESLANEPDGELSPINSENGDSQESGPVNPVLSGSRTEILTEYHEYFVWASDEESHAPPMIATESCDPDVSEQAVCSAITLCEPAEVLHTSDKYYIWTSDQLVPDAKLGNAILRSSYDYSTGVMGMPNIAFTNTSAMSNELEGVSSVTELPAVDTTDLAFTTLVTELECMAMVDGSLSSEPNEMTPCLTIMPEISENRTATLVVETYAQPGSQSKTGEEQASMMENDVEATVHGVPSVDGDERKPSEMSAMAAAEQYVPCHVLSSQLANMEVVIENNQHTHVVWSEHGQFDLPKIVSLNTMVMDDISLMAHTTAIPSYAAAQNLETPEESSASALSSPPSHRAEPSWSIEQQSPESFINRGLSDRVQPCCDQDSNASPSPDQADGDGKLCMPSSRVTTFVKEEFIQTTISPSNEVISRVICEPMVTSENGDYSKADVSYVTCQISPEHQDMPVSLTSKVAPYGESTMGPVSETTWTDGSSDVHPTRTQEEKIISRQSISTYQSEGLSARHVQHPPLMVSPSVESKTLETSTECVTSKPGIMSLHPDVITRSFSRTDESASLSIARAAYQTCDYVEDISTVMVLVEDFTTHHSLPLQLTGSMHAIELSVHCEATYQPKATYCAHQLAQIEFFLASVLPPCKTFPLVITEQSIELESAQIMPTKICRTRLHAPSNDPCLTICNSIQSESVHSLAFKHPTEAILQHADCSLRPSKVQSENCQVSVTNVPRLPATVRAESHSTEVQHLSPAVSSTAIVTSGNACRVHAASHNEILYEESVLDGVTMVTPNSEKCVLDLASGVTNVNPMRCHTLSEKINLHSVPYQIPITVMQKAKAALELGQYLLSQSVATRVMTRCHEENAESRLTEANSTKTSQIAAPPALDSALHEKLSTASIIRHLIKSGPIQTVCQPVFETSEFEPIRERQATNSRLSPGLADAPISSAMQSTRVKDAEIMAPLHIPVKTDTITPSKQQATATESHQLPLHIANETTCISQELSSHDITAISEICSSQDAVTTDASASALIECESRDPLVTR